MIVVGMVSAYKEGRLVRGAVLSLLEVGLDALYVYEGPAGAPLGEDVPDSDYEGLEQQSDGLLRLRRGRWRTDARKRNEMLQQAKRDFPGQKLWGVVVDGDEVLCNGAFLRDQLQAVVWNDEWQGASPDDRARPPVARCPLRLVERDGTVSTVTARLIRLDLLRSIDISSSVVTNLHGVQEGWGNFPERSAIWLEGWLHAIDAGNLICFPPFPGEPCLVHRSHLRHPARRRLRMSDQEASSFEQEKRRRGLIG